MTKKTKGSTKRRRVSQNPTASKAKKHLKGERHDFTLTTRKVIAERSGYRCANPACGAVTVGPSRVDSAKSARVGVAAHIHAASPHGPRYLAKQTEAERSSAENGLWMCQTCGTLVDSDYSGHTAEELKEWKEAAERRAKAEFGLPKSGTLFRLRDGDQTTYINLPRFHEIATAKGFQLQPIPPFNRALLASDGQLSGVVLSYEGVLDKMKLDAIPITDIKTKDQCEAVVGRLVSFKGRFRSRNAPKLKRGRIPEYHPTGDPDRDHVIWKQFGSVELVLSLDSFWYASHSSVGFFRANGKVPVHGIARVHRATDGRVVASPVWMALPNEPLFD